MKECFKCKKVFELAFFYKNKQMKDGHVNKCKDCNKNDVAIHRLLNINKIREYDRKRGNRQDIFYLKEWRKENPKKYRAHNIVNNAIRDNKLFSEPCTICGCDKSVAHHDDYDKPLNIRWLCQPHHKQWHAKNGEGLNPR